MKIFLLFLTICFAFANAQGINPSKNLEKIPQNKIQRTISVSRDTLSKENWFEVEKNEIVKICIDKKIKKWKTSLKAAISNDSCLTFQAPTLVGVDTIKVYFSQNSKPHNINLAVGMKYLDFKNEEVLLGFNQNKGKLDNIKWKAFVYKKKEEDPERLTVISAKYLIDKYPVTNCEITQLMWDSIPSKTSFEHPEFIEIAESWFSRKRRYKRDETCNVNDTAANTVYLYQAMKYANARSVREGLKPYYKFSPSDAYMTRILSKGLYDIVYYDFTKYKNDFIRVSIDYSSDGYRLPFYDEWMMFARGGDKKKDAIWGNWSTPIEEVLKYAKFGSNLIFTSEPVGQLQPNGYGLYDIFGLVWEHVLFEETNPFSVLRGTPSCLKGGNNSISLKENNPNDAIVTSWQTINYGYSSSNTGAARAGFRLIRNIGNNAKWTEVKSK